MFKTELILGKENIMGLVEWEKWIMKTFGAFWAMSVHKGSGFSSIKAGNTAHFLFRKYSKKGI